MTEWWDIAQKVGSGAAFVLGIGVWAVWKAYREEVTYSKDRDRQTLEVLLKLTKITEGIDKRDEMSERYQSDSKRELLEAIRDLKTTIIAHFDKRQHDK